MGIHVIKVPDIGEGIAEVELVEWHVQPGDSVTEDQGLADVMTDKANVEIPTPVAGKVIALGGKPGDTLAVGSELIRLEVDGAGNVASSAAPPAEAPSPAAQAAATARIEPEVPRTDPKAAAAAPSKPAAAAAAPPTASPAQTSNAKTSNARAKPHIRMG